uniref:SWIM-type domain-containing protein n=1 Tax=Ananas comosus var. bracteatus TaxID=296719 RepID=A0A6V7QX45_ANACO
MARTMIQRASEDQKPTYVNGSGYFTMEIHHGGFFAFIPDRFYMGGKIDYYDFGDPDLLSLLDIKDKAKDDLGYPDEEQVNYYWCKPGSSLNLGIEKLNNDKDVCEMALHASKTTRVALYMEPMIELDVGSCEQQTVDTKTILDELNNDSNQQHPDDHVIAEELDNRDEEMDDGEKDHANRSDDESDSLFIESYYDLTDDDELSDKNVDTHVEVGVGTKTSTTIDDVPKDSNSDTDYELSDELHSVDDSSEDDLVMRRRYPEFRAETDMQNPQFGIGMLFASMKEFRQAIREYSIKNRYNIKLVKNEKDKVRAVCKEGCPWLIYASWITGKKTVQVKRYDFEHKCFKNFKNKFVTSSWLAKKYIDRFRNNPKWPLTAFGECVTADIMALLKLWRILFQMLSTDFDLENFKFGSSHGQFVVDLIQKTCSCRRWDLTGLPYPHAISAMLHENLRPKD